MRRTPATAAAVRLFAGLALILVALVPPTIYSSDGNAMYEVAQSVATRLSVDIPCHLGVLHDGACYSRHYPLLSLLAVPFAGVGNLLGELAGVSGAYTGRVVALVIPALSIALAGVMTAAMARRHGAGPRGAVLAACVAVFGTELLAYSRTFYAEPLCAALVAVAVYGVTSVEGDRRRWGLLALGLAVLAKPTMVVVAPALALALLLTGGGLRRAAAPLAAAAVGGLLYTGWVVALFGSLPGSGGGTGQLMGNHAAAAAVVVGSSTVPEATPLWQTPFVYLFSPGDGLLWFAPVAAVGVVLLLRRRHDPLAAASLLSAAALLLVYCGVADDGYSWGTRYLVPVIPLLVAPLGALRGRGRTLVLALAAATFLIQVPTLVAFPERYFVEQRDLGRSTTDLHWRLDATPALAMFGTARRTVADARRTPATELLADAQAAGGPDRERLAVPGLIAQWWWMLPAIGIPWIAGFLVALAMIAAGVVLVLGAAGPRAAPPRAGAAPSGPDGLAPRPGDAEVAG